MSERPAAKSALPIVFLGPSLDVLQAAQHLTADYRPPIRRGDLGNVLPGATVAIIDGVFDQALAVSPSEIRVAVSSGVRIFGSSSMGALRAAEIPEMRGIGRVHALYAEEAIESDDEVALVFDPDTHRALSEPLVNVRYAVERLRSSGTLDPGLCERIVEAAKRIHYPDRVYPLILREAGVTEPEIIRQLTAMLRVHDLKREDAITLLELLARDPGSAEPAPALDAAASAARAERVADVLGATELRAEQPAEAPLLFWEYGERVGFAELVRFLKLTNAFEQHARNALARHVLAGGELEPAPQDEAWDAGADVRAELALQRYHWGWFSGEESRVTLNDIGLGARDLARRVRQEVGARRRLMLLAREPSEAFLKALRAQLFLDDLALKRETIRCGSLRRLAREALRSDGPASPAELDAAREKLRKRIQATSWREAIAHFEAWGVPPAESEAFASELALARRAGERVLKTMFGSTRRALPPRASDARSDRHLSLKSSPKIENDGRFCLPLDRALEHTRALREVIGVTRVADITHLSPLGIPNTHAYRPDGRWSSTIGSGKSTTLAGAKVGAVMEEVEKWAQERFDDEAQPDLIASYEELSSSEHVLDPSLLDLPYDSAYQPGTPIGWYRCHDLIADRLIFVPLAALVAKRLPNDVFYTPRSARKILTTSGLASGFTLEEALTHALGELIERHAHKLAEIALHNPGIVGHGYRFVDPETLPASTRALAAKVHAAGQQLEILDITSEVRVPTYWAHIFSRQMDRIRRAPGTAVHPNPRIAIDMAVLEASQTAAGEIAGGREDIAIRSRSLGRHERTNAFSRLGYQWLGMMSDPPLRPFAGDQGFVSNDAHSDVQWMLERLHSAGVEHAIAVELGRAEIEPARVVRVITPGLETVNPFCTGLRARVQLLRDLLPLA